jgi:hypothetical protein
VVRAIRFRAAGVLIALLGAGCGIGGHRSGASTDAEPGGTDRGGAGGAEDAGPQDSEAEPVVAGDAGAIPHRAPLPDLTRAVDVESFRPADIAGKGPLFPPPRVLPNRVTVITDGTELLPPPCAAPVRVDTRPASGITVDGDLDDWQGVTPSIIDRDGDGIVASTGASIDLVRVFHTTDADNHYFAFVTKDDWPVDDAMAYVLLRQEQVDLPGPANDKPRYTLVHQLLVQPTAVFAAPNNVVTPLPAARYTVAARGRVIEVRLPRDELDPRVQSKTWLLDISINSGRSDARTDRAGDLIIGLATDYGCLVTLPNRRWKMFLLRRADDVDPQEAEVVYRGAIASAPYVESETGESFDTVDTMNVTVVRSMSVAGIHRGTSGMTISLATTSLLGLSPAPVDYFETTAHEYAHGINAVDWEVPQLWIAEGHSEQTARRVMRAAYNASLGQWRYRAHLYSFVADERSGGIAPLEPEPWDYSGGKTGSFYYAKAEAFIDLLSTLLPYSTLNRVWGKHELDGGRYANGAAVLDAITMQPGFIAITSPGMWHGWFGGTYEGSVLKRSLIETDSDGDGLLDYQEKALGLAPDNADTDGDGRSDLFELAMHTDPLTPEPLKGLSADNLLTDWERLAPGLLHPAVVEPVPGSGCAHVPRLTRYGVVFDGEWLVIAAELATPVTDATFQLLADVREPGGRRVTIAAQTEPPLIVAVENKQLLRAAPLPAPLYGTRQIEMAYHRTWLGWSPTMPPGTTVQVGTAAATRDMASGCEVSRDQLLPSQVVP